MSCTILIVDDSAIVRSVVRKVIALAGIEARQVHEAGDGEEALALLRDTPVDLVLADINMPRMSGSDLLARMRREPALAQTPVIMISSDQSEARMEELRRSGARAYVAKPFRPEQLGRVVRDVLREQGVGHAG